MHDLWKIDNKGGVLVLINARYNPEKNNEFLRNLIRHIIAVEYSPLIISDLLMDLTILVLSSSVLVSNHKV